jgi:hypothetical protein
MREAQIGSGASSTSKTEIAQLLADHAAAWSRLDLHRVADDWDPAEPSPSYVAEELGDVLLDHQSIVSHLLRTEHRLTSVNVTISELEVCELAPDLAVAIYVCRWEFDWVSYTRVSAILRRRDGVWRFLHFMEAPFHVVEN